jgi:hypothetical protein
MEEQVVVFETVAEGLNAAERWATAGLALTDPIPS